MDRNQPDERVKGEGMADELEGKVQEAWGDLTGDTSDKIAGKAKQAWGNVQQGVGEAMDTTGDAADTVDPD